MPSEPFSSAAERRTARLRAAYPEVQRLDWTLEDRPPRPYERKRYNVRLELDYAGRQLVINREHERDPLAALGEAFEAAQWQLEAAEAARHLGC